MSDIPREKNTMITDVNGFDVSRIIFGKVKESKIPGSSIPFYRIDIAVRNPDGTIGDLVLLTEEVYSYGLSEQKQFGAQTPTPAFGQPVAAPKPGDPSQKKGHVMSLVLWSRGSPTPQEKLWTDVYEAIANHCKNYLVSVRRDVKKFTLELTDLKNVGKFSWRIDKEKGEIKKDEGPSLYVKTSERKGKIDTRFIDAEGNEIDPMSTFGRSCRVRAAVHIKSLFVGNSYAMQTELYEVQVTHMLDMAKKKLIAPLYKPSKPLSLGSGVASPDEHDDELERTGSLEAAPLQLNLGASVPVASLVPPQQTTPAAPPLQTTGTTASVPLATGQSAVRRGRAGAKPVG
jgi:hypothetical protein